MNIRNRVVFLWNKLGIELSEEEPDYHFSVCITQNLCLVPPVIHLQGLQDIIYFRQLTQAMRTL